MIRENKDILLKVLSEQFSYEVLILDTAAKKHGKLYQINSDTVWYDCQETEDVECQSIFNVKPYLRPMSSMTEEEREEYWKFVEHRKILYDNGSYDGARNILRLDIPNRLSDFTDWLNSHHFDYRGLIPMNLALEAPEGMYKEE